jgi:hypothetical protein
MMRGALPGSGGHTPLLPVARFVGDWRAVAQVAENLRFTGALPLIIEEASGGPSVDVPVAAAKASG